LLLSGRIQLDPPGVLIHQAAGEPASFTNTGSSAWYLGKRRHHNYRWISSEDGNIVPFAIDVSGNSSGLLTYAGRIRRNGTTLQGNVVPAKGVIYYVDESGMSRSSRSGYEVLTCWTCKSEI
jgi:hypothetical protein